MANNLKIQKNFFYCEKHKEYLHMKDDHEFHCTKCDLSEGLSEELDNRPTVQLSGMDGNAFSILGRVSKALREYGLDDKVKEFQDKAMSGDYNHLLQVCTEYVNVR